jgi:hypothetical protein
MTSNTPTTSFRGFATESHSSTPTPRPPTTPTTPTTPDPTSVSGLPPRFPRHGPEQPILDPANPLGPAFPGSDQPPPSQTAPTFRPQSEEQETTLVSALTLLAQAIQTQQTPTTKPPRTKISEPDSFDGKNPHKLKDFLVQCRLNFLDRPLAFSSDRIKVNYAISFLKGNALSWFEPQLLEEQQSGFTPPTLESYELFVQELKDNFGPHDPVGTAETELESLKMKENHRIAQYLVSFNRFAVETGWETKALRHSFYRGLPNRIKDEISRIGKPETLLGMKELAQKIDSRYWERKSEVSRESLPSQQSSSSKSLPHQPQSSSSTPSTSTNKNAPKFPPKSTPTSSNTPKPRSDLSDKIGKDGKLTPAERKRRFENKLCMFCGSSGHVVKDCPRSSSTASKARAAKATPTAPVSDTPPKASEK